MTACRWRPSTGPRRLPSPAQNAVLDEFAGLLADRGIRSRRVVADFPGHSAVAEQFREELIAGLSSVRPLAPGIRFYSTVAGGPIDTAAPRRRVLVREPPSDGLVRRRRRCLIADGFELFVEPSPHPVLKVAIEETSADAGAAVAVVGSLRREEGGLPRFATSLAEAYVHGAPVDWSPLFPGPIEVPDGLPTYPFQRKRYWLEPRAGMGTGRVDAVGQRSADHPLLGAVVAAPDSGGVVLTRRLSVATHPWLAEHEVLGSVLLPATAFVEMAVRAGDQVGCKVLDELVIEAPLAFPGKAGVHVQILLGGARRCRGARGDHLRAPGGRPPTRNDGPGTLSAGCLARSRALQPDSPMAASCSAMPSRPVRDLR